MFTTFGWYCDYVQFVFICLYDLILTLTDRSKSQTVYKKDLPARQDFKVKRVSLSVNKNV